MSTTNNMTEKEIHDELSALNKKAADGRLTPTEANRMLELKLALRSIRTAIQTP